MPLLSRTAFSIHAWARATVKGFGGLAGFQIGGVRLAHGLGGFTGFPVGFLAGQTFGLALGLFLLAEKRRQRRLERVHGLEHLARRLGLGVSEQGRVLRLHGGLGFVVGLVLFLPGVLGGLGQLPPMVQQAGDFIRLSLGLHAGAVAPVAGLQ